MKKTSLTTLTIFFGLCLTLFACRKDIEYYVHGRERAPTELIKAAKIWHAQKLNRSDPSEKLIPRWQDAWIIEDEDGKSKLIVPAPERFVNNKDFSIRRFLIFYNSQNDIARGNIVEFVGHKYDVEKNIDFLLSKYDSKDLRDFSGSILTYDVNYLPVQSNTYGKDINKNKKTTLVTANNINNIQNINTKQRISNLAKTKANAIVGNIAYSCPYTPAGHYVNWPPNLAADCNVTFYIEYEYVGNCLESIIFRYVSHTCPTRSGSGSGSGSGGSNENPPYGGGGGGGGDSGQSSSLDESPSTYIWRNRLTGEDFSTHLSLLQPWYLTVNGEEVDNPNAFNCHFYTFGVVYATATAADLGRPNWVYGVSLPSSDWMQVTNNVQVGDVIIYKGVTPDGQNGMLHSGRVIEVANGKATLISSKMGEYEIISHHPRDVPSEYGSTNPTYTFDGETYQSRLYYRKK